MGYLRQSIEEAWGRRGPAVVRRNLVALDSALAALHEVELPDAVSATRRRAPLVPPEAPDFVQRVTRLLLEGRGDERSALQAPSHSVPTYPICLVVSRPASREKRS